MSEPLYLLDTSALLNVLRGKDLGKRINETFGLTELKNRPLISVVTHGEIWVLATRNNWGDEKRRALEHTLDHMVTVDLNHPDIIGAYVEADLITRRHPEGARNIGKNDLWIAACAKAAGAELITTDKDFRTLAEFLRVHIVESTLH